MDLIDLFACVLVFAKLLMTAVGICFLISGLDDFFIDICFVIRSLYRRYFLLPKFPPLTEKKLLEQSEQHIAVMIPAWDESAVIAAMLTTTALRFGDSDHCLYVGCYPNDPATIGIVAGLSARVKIDKFWDRGLPDLDNPDAAKFPDGPKQDDPLGIAYRAASAGKRQVLKAGDKLPLKGTAVEALVLAASGDVIDLPSAPSNPLCADAPPDKEVDRSDNARSVVLRFGLGQFHFLDCGDLTWNVEKQLVCPRNLVGPIDLYQVTHHGLDISNHPTLVRTIAPTVTVMNNGPRKGGSAATVALLKSIPSIRAAYQLHKNAATGPDENTDPDLIVNDDPEGGQFLRVTVEPDGSRYTVRIGADGSPRAFDSK